MEIRMVAIQVFTTSGKKNPFSYILWDKGRLQKLLPSCAMHEFSANIADLHGLGILPGWRRDR